MNCTKDMIRIFMYLLVKSKQCSPIVTSYRHMAKECNILPSTVSVIMRRFRASGIVRIKKGETPLSPYKILVNRDYKLVPLQRPKSRWQAELRLSE